ncbi:hypothetical protein OpiT1DRAFT_05926 [Opitutaceae bacterium TAV1]|nr:hypothetical protein OpiT1DRAFT_05926 [Opitutaceae bacterium TAV1]
MSTFRGNAPSKKKSSTNRQSRRLKGFFANPNPKPKPGPKTQPTQRSAPPAPDTNATNHDPSRESVWPTAWLRNIK